MREGSSMSGFRSYFPGRWADVYFDHDKTLYDLMYEDFKRDRDMLWEHEMSIRKNLPEPEIRSGLLTVDTDEMKKVFAK